MTLNDIINWINRHRTIAAVGIAIPTVTAVAIASHYFWPKHTEPERKEERTEKREDLGYKIRMYEKESAKDEEKRNYIAFKFKPTIKMPEITIQAEEDAAFYIETKILPEFERAYRDEIGDRGATGYELKQILGRIDDIDCHNDRKIITLSEVQQIHKRIFEEAKGDKEKIREILNLNLDAPYFEMLSNDQELYNQALNARDEDINGVQERCNIPQGVWKARNEHQARAYRSALTRNRKYNDAVGRHQRARAR